MEIISMSKRQASKYKPYKPTLMISIQDGQLQEYPFKERTNHITRNRYVDTLFLYFDDINPNLVQGNPYFPFAFSDSDALKIINFLTYHFEKNDFTDIIIHCQEGIIRGFFNEQLNSKLTPHRKVTEILGSKLKIPAAEFEPSDVAKGYGFSETKDANLILRLTYSNGRKELVHVSIK